MQTMQKAIQEALALTKNTRHHESTGGVGQIKGYCPVKKVACGNCHTLVLKEESVFSEDGHSDPRVFVYGWGKNRYNTLGMPERKKDSSKDSDDGMPDTDHDSKFGSSRWIDAVKGPPSKEVFMKQNPLVDHSVHGQEGAEPVKGAEFVEVSCGANHSVLLSRIKTKGNDDPHKDTEALHHCHLWSWGLNGNGRLGRGSNSNSGPVDNQNGHTKETDNEGEYSAPQMVDFGAPLGYIHGHIVVQRVACGTDHTLAICNILASQDATIPSHQGRVFAWGMGSYGALGVKHKGDVWTPEEVFFINEGEYDDKARCISIKQIACGSKHSAALSHDGRMFTWGHGGNGRLGSGVTKTRLGQSFSAEFQPCFVSALEDTKLTFIAAGEAHTGAVDQLGGLWTWGQGANGRLGHGSMTDRVTPKKVENLIGISIAEIGFGMMHSIAVTGKGTLYGWGKGPATGLDKGDQEVIQIPMMVPLQGSDREEVYQVACGPLHTMVLLKDGTLFAFGSGSECRLPFGFEQGRDVAMPRKMQDFKGVVHNSRQPELAKGKQHHLQKGGPLLPLAVECGGSNSAAVLNNGQLWIWGDEIMTSSVDGAPKDYADEDKDDKQLAEDVSVWFPALLRRGFHSVKIRAISIGQLHVLALSEDQRLYAWGDGGAGQLGTGTLDPAPLPKLIPNMEDVIHISAGEEHSACIIGGGESYTWGSAEGGRLGLTATMNEGTQMLPNLVVTQSTSTDPRVETIPKDLRLRSVTCGSAHTAWISTNDRVMTCGLGWFGRLGQGGSPSPENCYAPLFVKERSIRAMEVHCASYHTCIIDRERRLWVCGRDSSLCKSPGHHVNTPELFEPFNADPKRYVHVLSCSDQHTLAVTSLRPDAAGGNELWVWGKNNRGQLGMSDIEVPRIDRPFLLRLPGVNNKHQRVTKIATTSWHSMVVLETKKPVTASEAAKGRRNFEVYAWGYSGSGRLGLRRPDPEEEFQKSLEGEVAPACGTHVMLPGKVDCRWRPLKSSDFDLPTDTVDDQENVQTQRFEELLQKPIRSWSDIQQLLHAEDPEHKQLELLKKAQHVSGIYNSFMDDVCHLWDKPPEKEDRRTEFNMRQQKREIESQYIRTLAAMNLSQSIHAPRIEATMKTEKSIAFRMHNYEELVWILQQQPLYLCNLAQSINKNRSEPECEWFHRFTGALYQEMVSPRVRNLFKALLRVMITKEVEQMNSLEELFSPLKSRVANIITQFTTNPFFSQSIMKPILDPDDEHSLIYLIIRYTLTRDSKNPRVDAKNPQAYISGVFAANGDEYEDMDVASRESRKLGPRSMEDKNKGRQSFTDDQRDFEKLINGIGGRAVPFDDSEGALDEYSATEEVLKEHFHGIDCLDTYSWQWMRNMQRGPEMTEEHWRQKQAMEEALRQKVMKLFHSAERQKNVMSFDVRPVKDFIGRFLREHLKQEKNYDFQMLLVFVMERLVSPAARRHVIQFKNTSGEGWLPELLAPICSVVLASMLAGVLFAVSREGHLAMMRVKIDEKIKKMEKEFLAANEENEEDPGLNKRVWWNIEHLARFFERVVHRQAVYEAQIDQRDGQGKPEEIRVGETADKLKKHVCLVLQEVLQTNKSVAMHREDGAGYQKDETETQLTVDLYTAHYNMKPQIVTLSTVDLLLLTNYLHLFMEGDSRNQDNIVVRIDKAETDRVCQLVKMILPEDVQEQGTKKVVKTVPWDAGYLAVAHLTGEKHNLSMRARFMEFETGELTFCEISQAPIPRSLATENQKGRQGTGNRAVKPLRNNRGPVFDIPGIGDSVYPWEEVMLLLELMAGSAKGGDENYSADIRFKIHGSSWSEFKNDIEEYQRKISEDMEEGRTGAAFMAELLQRLDNGRTFISKIRDSTEPAELRDYMHEEIRKRYEYNEYLFTLRMGIAKIKDAKDGYRSQVQDIYEALRMVNEKTVTCEIPEEISNAALAHTERLKFMDAKKVKVVNRRTRPTPAQQVYDDLLAHSAERDTEKLKEMVGFPARTFTKYDLEKKGVLVKLNSKIPPGVQKAMKFTFQYEDEGYTVKIFMQRTLLREFPITRRDIELMNQARKTAVISYGDDFVSVHCFRLRRLLSEVMAQGGL